MKIISQLSAICAFLAFSHVANLEPTLAAQELNSILETQAFRPMVAVQDAPASVIEIPATPAPGIERLPPPQIQLQPSVQMPYLPNDQLIIDHNIVQRAMFLQPFVPAVCESCGQRSCRCGPPAPARVVFCLVDPSGCQHQACVSVPACCAGLQPTVSWKKRLLGRQIATLCWDCCDHDVKVVVTRKGEVKVRG